MVLRFFLLLYIVTATLGADEISELISKIHHAQSSQKRILINQLKLKLHGVNASKRAEAIANLRHNIRVQHQAFQTAHTSLHQTNTHRLETGTSSQQLNKHGRR